MAKSKEKKKGTPAEEEEKDDAIVEKRKKSETVDIKIQTICENPDQKSFPMIGYFPSCYDPLKDSDMNPPKVKVYKNIKSPNPNNPRLQLVVESSKPKMNFVGSSHSGEAATTQLCNYALGVLDKETGVLKMVPIAANRIFRLAPKRKGSEVMEDVLQEKANEDTGKEDTVIKNMYLTKKKIRDDKRRNENLQPEEPGMKDNVEGKLQKIQIKPDALLEAPDETIAHGQNIPPYDLEATSPEMAYPLDKIIHQGEWRSLSDIYDLIEAGSEVNRAHYPIFVCNRIAKLKNVKDISKKQRLAGVLSYITHLIKYKDKHSMDGVSSAKHHNIPSILSHKFLQMFGMSGGDRRIPDEKQKLLINYVLVLSLIADNFMSHSLDIAKDLRMSEYSLRDYYSYLGCKFVSENKIIHAKLQVPLKFDTAKRRRRR